MTVRPAQRAAFPDEQTENLLGALCLAVNDGVEEGVSNAAGQAVPPGPPRRT